MLKHIWEVNLYAWWLLKGGLSEVINALHQSWHHLLEPYWFRMTSNLVINKDESSDVRGNCHSELSSHFHVTKAHGKCSLPKLLVPGFNSVRNQVITHSSHLPMEKLRARPLTLNPRWPPNCQTKYSYFPYLLTKRIYCSISCYKIHCNLDLQIQLWNLLKRISFFLLLRHIWVGQYD